MKNLRKMNVNKNSIFFIALFYTIFSFSQKKDVFFLIEKNNNKYVNVSIFNKSLKYITLFQRKEYEQHKEKVREAKKKGTYSYNPESGRDNLKIHVPKLTFRIISKKEVKLSEEEISKLNLIDYDWITKNSWKKIAKQPSNFKNIYFLYKERGKEKKFSYKVELTMVEY